MRTTWSLLTIRNKAARSSSPHGGIMQFKTSAQIKAEKESSGRDTRREEDQKQKRADASSRKYARMAEESAKREAARKEKPKLVVLPGVIVAPVLKAANLKGEGQFASKAPAKQSPKPKGKQVVVDVETTPVVATTKRLGAGPKVSKADAKQVWDDATKQWVKRA